MRDIISICHKAICELNISHGEKETLLRELAEFGFTENLKQKLGNYLDIDINDSRNRLSEISDKTRDDNS